MAGQPLTRLRHRALDSKAAEQRVLDLVANGFSLRQIAERLSGTGVTFEAGYLSRWLRETTDRAARYRTAREAAAEHLATEIVQIADSTLAATDPNQIASARLRMDARKWVASKLLPHYSDRHRVDLKVGKTIEDYLLELADHDREEKMPSHARVTLANAH